MDCVVTPLKTLMGFSVHLNVQLKFYNLPYDIASKYGFTIAHMEIGKDDHIHLLVSAPPKLSVTNIMRWLKGISA